MDKIQLQDFVSDAHSAVDFLRSGVTGLPLRSVSLVGHSQGCTVAAIVAKQRGDIRSLVLLNGAAVPLDQVFGNQSARQKTYLQHALSQLQELNAPQQQIVQVAQSMEMAACGEVAAPAQFAMVLRGEIPVSVQAGVLISGYVNASIPNPGPHNHWGVECPLHCACYSGVSPDCLIPCQTAAVDGALLLNLDFLMSWYRATTEAALVDTWSFLPVKNVLLVNSWTDVKVPPASFEPFMTLLASGLPQTNASWVDGNPTPTTSFSVQLFTNITHDLTIFPPVSNPTLPIPVVGSVLEAVSAFLVPTPPIPEDDDSHPGRWIYVTVGILATTTFLLLVAFITLLLCFLKQKKRKGSKDSGASVNRFSAYNSLTS